MTPMAKMVRDNWSLWARFNYQVANSRLEYNAYLHSTWRQPREVKAVSDDKRDA